jgi:group II intron reverse transcriptase/maturase
MAVAKPCKLSDLPNVEITRGPEHVTKAIDRELKLLYDLLPSTVLHDSSIYACGAFDNPIVPNNNDIIMSLSSDQSVDEATIITLQSQTIKQSTGSKKYYAHKESTTGFPKGSNPYGDGVPILVTWKRVHPSKKVGQRTFSTTSAAAVPNYGYISGSDLESRLKMRNGKYYDLLKLVSNPDVLFGAYHCINSKPGNMTPGTDNKTLDGISPEFFTKLSKDIRSEKFQFKPTRRLYIPKPNGNLRPLGIPSPRDKIVQKAMELVLNLIFEPRFLDTSHGFRPYRSCQSALKQVAKWNGYDYAIEGYIKGYFDNIHHTLLASFLEKELHDQQFMDLYWKLARAGYVEDYKFIDSNLGVPQGGVLSPLLSNIYLHEFDLFMNVYINKHSSKEKNISKVNSKIVAYSQKLSALHETYIEKRDPEILKEIRSLRKERNSLPSRIRTCNRISYVRYADDWMIGIIGKKEFAEQVKEDVKLFLENTLKLPLSVEKTKITSLTKDKARFLGADIHIPKAKESKMVCRTMNGRSIPSRINQVRVNFLMPYKEIIENLAKEGFLKDYKPGGKIITNAITKWIFLEHRAIIIRYNSIINGYLKYYSFVDNYHRFHTIINYILKHSCAKTLARKFRLGSRAGAFKKFGSKLGTVEKNAVSLKIPTSYTKLKKLNISVDY